MLIVTVSCLLLIAVTTLIHYEVLRGLHVGLPKLRIRVQSKLVVAILVAFVAHAVEIVLYGIALFVLIRYAGAGDLGGHRDASFLDCLYFSAETYTSLGLGDVASKGPVRFLAGAAALNGLLLIAWTASFLYLAMERFWATGAQERKSR